jgi:hypothetical protein
MASNDDLELGVGNSSNDPTVILASVNDDGGSGFTLGRAVFEAGPSDTTAPLQPYIGVLGRGSGGNDGRGYPPSPGVAGFGGRYDGDDSAGAGVVGVGGDTSGHHPGPGVIGTGGINAYAASPPDSDAFGAGVVGVSGGLSLPDRPTLFHGAAPALTANVGVYGESAYGSGVRGISQRGDGVYGSANDAVGVRGDSTGGVGVAGTSAASAGVSGFSKAGHGGVFAAGDQNRTRPQLRLVPQGQGLPSLGQFGDLLVRVVPDGNNQPTAQLWLCIREPDDMHSALWGEVAIAGALFGVGS